MRNFAISDHHFYHGKIIEYCERPFGNVGEMNAYMIECWNNVVTPEDTVYHLGDFAFTYDDPEQQRRILERLHGRKILIVGNHDLPLKKCKEVGWHHATRQFQYTTASGRVALMQHRPWLDDTLPPGIEVVLHGHIHNRPAKRGHININVSVEALDYTPVLIDELVDGHMAVMGYYPRLTTHGQS